MQSASVREEPSLGDRIVPLGGACAIVRPSCTPDYVRAEVPRLRGHGGALRQGGRAANGGGHGEGTRSGSFAVTPSRRTFLARSFLPGARACEVPRGTSDRRLRRILGRSRRTVGGRPLLLDDRRTRLDPQNETSPGAVAPRLLHSDRERADVRGYGLAD
jgi:hypothetical protein